MGEITKISWCDHTFNPWIGCTKVSEGCRNCYAERDNLRFGWVDRWGKSAPRKLTSDANWKKPLNWAKKAKEEGVIRMVFCASLADVFDAEVDQSWKERLWELIAETSLYGSLEWLILTKRPENIDEMLHPAWLDNPPDDIRIGVTAEDQNNTHRIYELLTAWSGKNFVSYEPALGEIDISYSLNGCPERDVYGEWYQTRHPVDWVIMGGESGPNARPMHPDWARSVRDQCQAAGVPFFFKQWGEWYPTRPFDPKPMEDVPCHQWNGGICAWKVGKKNAGHLLDGSEWREFPE